MKAKNLLPLLFLAHFGRAAIVVPGANGTDGALNVTANTEIDLSQAVTGVWDQDNTANLGKGVYDPAKWAVVFKYTDVTIAAGATVTFKNHPSRAPVVWLVSGNVTIDGVVSLNGQSGHRNAPQLTEPGPGGSRGGAGKFSTGVNGSSGLGVGGGRTFAGGGYGTDGVSYDGATGHAYGNPSIIPLIGGSGGGGDQDDGRFGVSPSGGGGGGALLVACQSSFNCNGSILANGGPGLSGGDTWGSDTSGGGAGGAVRIIANTLLGSGEIQAVGGSNPNAGGHGRVRVERAVNTNTISVIPAPSIVDLAPNDTAMIWPPTNSPKVRVLSVGGILVPEDPRAAFGTTGADVSLPVASSVPVVIETVNVEQSSVVTLRIAPRNNFDAQVIPATRVDPPVSTSPLTYHWTADVPTNLGYSAIQVKVVRP